MTAFVANLADLVRRLALESVRDAPASLAVSPPAKRRVAPRRSVR
jgi:hypothetical protein